MIGQLSFDNYQLSIIKFRQFQSTEQPDQEVYALANDDRIVAVKIRSQAREMSIGAVCRLKLKYHRHEVGGIKEISNLNSQITNDSFLLHSPSFPIASTGQHVKASSHRFFSSSVAGCLNTNE